MDLLSSFLDKFKKIEDPKKARLKAAEILTQVLGTEFTDAAVSIKKGAVTITAPLIVKNQLFMKKEEVLEKLQAALPELFITDIR